MPCYSWPRLCNGTPTGFAGQTPLDATGTGSFDGGSGTYAGTATRDISAVIDRGSKGVPGISASSQAFDQSNKQKASFTGGGPGITIGTEAVPEPGTMTMSGIASDAGLLLRLNIYPVTPATFR